MRTGKFTPNLLDLIRNQDCKPIINENGGISIFFDCDIDYVPHFCINNYNYIKIVYSCQNGTCIDLLDAQAINESASSQSNVVTLLSEAFGYGIFEIDIQLGLEIKAIEWEERKRHFDSYVENKTAITKDGKILVSFERIRKVISLEYMDIEFSGCPDWIVYSQGYKSKKKINFHDLNLVGLECSTKPRDFEQYLDWMIDTNKGKNEVNPYRTKSAIKTNKEFFLKLKELARNYEKPFSYFPETKEETVKMDVPISLEGYVRSMIDHHR